MTLFPSSDCYILSALSSDVLHALEQNLPISHLKLDAYSLTAHRNQAGAEL